MKEILLYVGGVMFLALLVVVCVFGTISEEEAREDVLRRLDALEADRVAESETLLVDTPPATRPSTDTLQPLFDAIRMVESSDGKDTRDGDGGASIGPYQIGLAYWIDADMPDGTYEDCRNASYAERVMLRYWRRWCPDALDARDYATLSRIHNGGPRGDKKQSTMPYWAKVKAELERDGRWKLFSTLGMTVNAYRTSSCR